MKKYNIAFVSSYNDLYTSLITDKRKCSFGYCIGNSSIPHITICQFLSDSLQVESIWHSVCQKLANTRLSITFKHFSNITFDNKIYWLSLIPEERNVLLKIFSIVSKYVVSSRKDVFDPHLTLLNYQKKDFFNEKYLERKILINDYFYLALGECDEIGQLIKIIFKS